MMLFTAELMFSGSAVTCLSMAQMDQRRSVMKAAIVPALNGTYEIGDFSIAKLFE